MNVKLIFCISHKIDVALFNNSKVFHLMNFSSSVFYQGIVQPIIDSDRKTY